MFDSTGQDLENTVILSTMSFGQWQDEREWVRERASARENERERDSHISNIYCIIIRLFSLLKYDIMNVSRAKRKYESKKRSTK